MKSDDVFNFPEILWRADNFLALRLSRILTGSVRDVAGSYTESLPAASRR